MGYENVFIIVAFLICTLYFALSVSLLAVTDFGEQKKGRDIAIALAVLTGLPGAAAILCVVGVIIGLCTGTVALPWASSCAIVQFTHNQRPVIHRQSLELIFVWATRDLMIKEYTKYDRFPVLQLLVFPAI